jgi:hypothetical protein
MKDLLWIEHIVESTPTPPFLINFIVDMVGFVHPQKEVVMNAFSALLSA